MTRVIHTGDTHLGYQQYHLPARREDFLAAFRRVAEDAIEAEVDAVVHAGDLFHDRRPDLPDLLGTLSVLRDLDDAGVPFLAVVGNHETKRDGQWLDLFESMGLATRLGSEPVVVGDTAFYGMDFVPRSQRDSLDYQFEPHDATHAALVTHGLFEPLVPDYGNVEWDAEEVLAATNIEFQAMLLGDEHTPERVEIGDTWITYCGSTERASAGEREERGYNIVEFADGDARITRRGIPTREFAYIEVDLGEGEGIDRVREQVGQHDLTDAVAIVTIDGDGEAIKPARVEEFVHEQGALVARVNDRRETAEETDIEVSFADPDDAVRERVRELGLSPAARDLDETIRASKVADSNVADEVERRIREVVDEGDTDAFEPASADVETETVADRMQNTDAAADGGEDSAAEDSADDSAPDEEPTGERSESDADSDAAGDAAEPATSGADTVETPDEPDDTADSSTGIDDQSSMEDYL
ncbi:DNA double-strand break repair protein Mre11 [Halorarius litoreus]|uniref:DNA double-strand break repair protein Mre11 n=1 Tax=Halorarius litoreus TaxID=2962676 RepID=UPI0020CE99A0|nr:DNA double-strand break repair protein Mre11 [Halorarius litoreus]